MSWFSVISNPLSREFKGRTLGVMRLGVTIVAAALAASLVACTGTETPDAVQPIQSEQTRTPPTRPDETPDSSALQTVYFDYDDSTLRPDAREALRKNATYLKTYRDVAVEVQGNCDERGTEEYNLALGKRRAEAAKSYLVDLGVNSARVATVSFGEEKPVAVGHDEASWAKNRRSDFIARD